MAGEGKKRLRIVALRNGPILVEIGGKTVAALCRCGGSSNKPYCDGTHARIGFRAEEKVVVDAEL